MSNERLDSRVVTLSNHANCGSCDTPNHSDAKFCAECGQSLYESCGACAKPVLLTQSFCNECGTNLDEAIEGRRRKYEQWMADAVRAAKSHDYETAKDLLARVADLADYRFRSHAADATKAIAKITEIESRTLAAVKKACALASEANEAGRPREVVKHLANLPDNLLDEKSKKLLAKSQAFTSQWDALETELKSAIETKDWASVGALVQQLLELDPTYATGLKLAEQVAGKLVTAAKRSIEKGEYEMAVAQLHSIPDAAANPEIAKMRSQAENITWLSKQFDGEPYASPMLGRLAVRFAKETPTDPQAQQLPQELSQHLKQAPRASRMHLPAWKARSTSWLGGNAGMLAQPRTIRVGDRAELKTAPTSFNVAIGLSLQGLGKGRILEDFLIRKKSLLSFGKRKHTSCWGLDIGTSAVKGVLIQETESGPEITETFFAELETPVARRRSADEERKALLPAIEQFLEQKQPGEIPVWVNLDPSQTVNRFVRLPPVKDKEANNLLTQEIESKIPIPADDLVVVRWIHEDKRHPTLGRPAVAATAKREAVIRRTDLIESCGLKIAGMQCDTIALVNFAQIEFAELWPSERSKEDEDLDAYAEAISKSIAFIDCGAATTNLILISGEAHWSWTVELGGDDLTFQIASGAKTTRAEAEKLKRNPAALANPAQQYQPVEHNLDVLRSRLNAIFKDAQKQGNSFKPVQSWCMGGAWQTHQWVRRVMLQSSST